MSKKFGAAVATATLALGLGAGTASAHEGPGNPVGEPGTPNCHGKRVSHGSSHQGITPKDRAGFNGITVKEFHERVRAACSAPGA